MPPRRAPSHYTDEQDSGPSDISQRVSRALANVASPLTSCFPSLTSDASERDGLLSRTSSSAGAGGESSFDDSDAISLLSNINDASRRRARRRTRSKRVQDWGSQLLACGLFGRPKGQLTAHEYHVRRGGTRHARTESTQSDASSLAGAEESGDEDAGLLGDAAIARLTQPEALAAAEEQRRLAEAEIARSEAAEFAAAAAAEAQRKAELAVLAEQERLEQEEQAKLHREEEARLAREEEEAAAAAAAQAAKEEQARAQRAAEAAQEAQRIKEQEEAQAAHQVAEAEQAAAEALKAKQEATAAALRLQREAEQAALRAEEEAAQLLAEQEAETAKASASAARKAAEQARLAAEAEEEEATALRLQHEAATVAARAAAAESARLATQEKQAAREKRRAERKAARAALEAVRTDGAETRSRYRTEAEAEAAAGGFTFADGPEEEGYSEQQQQQYYEQGYYGQQRNGEWGLTSGPEGYGYEGSMHPHQDDAAAYYGSPIEAQQEVVHHHHYYHEPEVPPSATTSTASFLSPTQLPSLPSPSAGETYALQHPAGDAAAEEEEEEDADIAGLGFSKRRTPRGTTYGGSRSGGSGSQSRNSARQARVLGPSALSPPGLDGRRGSEASGSAEGSAAKRLGYRDKPRRHERANSRSTASSTGRAREGLAMLVASTRQSPLLGGVTELPSSAAHSGASSPAVLAEAAADAAAGGFDDFRPPLPPHELEGFSYEGTSTPGYDADAAAMPPPAFPAPRSRKQSYRDRRAGNGETSSNGSSRSPRKDVYAHAQAQQLASPASPAKSASSFPSAGLARSRDGAWANSKHSAPSSPFAQPSRRGEEEADEI